MKRATYICWMHKARALANYEFWSRYYEVTGSDKVAISYMKDEWIKELQLPIDAPYITEQ